MSTNLPYTGFFSQKPNATTRKSSRHPPLHSCGVSIFTIADIAFEKSQDINGPLGSTLRRMAKSAKFAVPLIYAIQYQCLLILSFLDHHILAFEKRTEKLFPPSTYVFDKIDEGVSVIESLPEKFDEAVHKFPSIIHQFPILEWTLTNVISRLNSLISMLSNQRGHQDQDSSVNEKTIDVDMMNWNHEHGGEDVKCVEKHFHDTAMNNNNIHMKVSYKEALERGKEEKTDHFIGSYKEALERGKEKTTHKIGSYKEALERGKEENVANEKMGKHREEQRQKKIDACECDEGGEKKKKKKNGGNNFEEKGSAVTDKVERSNESSNDPILKLFESAWLRF